MTDPDPRDGYGPLVHATRLAHEADRAAAEDRVTFFLGSWEDRAEWQRELDRRIGAAVAVRAVADARLRNEQLEVEVATYRAHLPAILGALRAQVANAPYRAIAKPYSDALMALRGSGEEEPRDTH